MTTPPPGRPARTGFKDKYLLLSNLQKNGVSVFLNEKLHAKAYLFRSTTDATTSIVGSANLTGPGFGLVHAPDESLVEMAVVSDDSALFGAASEFIEDKVLNDRRTEDYATWFARNSMEIGKAGL